MNEIMKNKMNKIKNLRIHKKKAWDGKMLAEHGDEWPAVFAGWAQRLVQAHEGGDRTAVSKFMHDEPQRCFAEEVALTVP